MATIPHADWPRIPHVGVGCIVMHGGKLLMVKSHSGFWSTPGGHLDFGESPAQCAARETEEETGVRVSNAEFVAVTNDILPATGKHYVTIWMRSDANDYNAVIGDAAEIAEVGWFPPDELPTPLFVYFENLISGRCMPSHAAVLVPID